ncbi:beta-galactosidase [Kribbella karoonensis]|uniref:Glycoside hydrolase 35 catalytic domain-containing protein n=1 Tax=Kribbella karoonensis TaxID=324851 RepID=A0ABN2DZQ9_9ACTN
MTDAITVRSIKATARVRREHAVVMGDQELGANRQYLVRAGRPWIPVMGEFHFSRYPAAEWSAELRKLRSGGITVVSSYVLWHLHEERRGEFDWSGDLDLRRFVEACRDAGLDFCLRIGPWGHAEARYGGFPDWLMAADCVPRTDDPAYLALVDVLYRQIAAQIDGLHYDQGGPIIAVQVENELYDNPAHLATLKRMARAAGIDAPFWTATGWGHAQLPDREVLPLFGGYSEAAWDDSDAAWPQQSRAHYFFSAGRDDDSIGADLRDAEEIAAAREQPTMDVSQYPFATCELGGGMYTSYHRRPWIQPADVTALSLVKIGSGSVWQGFYMYHGGTQRIGQETTFQESHATGYPNDCPVRTYDFQAPIGEYGQLRPHWELLRRQANWLSTMGADLAPLELQLPDDAPADTSNTRDLRWCLRTDGSDAYLFVNNHQPVETLPDHDGVQFEVMAGGRRIVVPDRPVTIRSGEHFAWPVAITVGGVRLFGLTAQVQALVDLDDGPLLVCFRTAGVAPGFHVETASAGEIAGECSVTVEGDLTRVGDLTPGLECVVELAGRTSTVRILVLDEESSCQASVERLAGRDRLVISSVPAIGTDDGLEVQSSPAPVTLRVIPPVVPAAEDGTPVPKATVSGIAGVVRVELPEQSPSELRAVLQRRAGRWKPSIDERTGRASAPDDEAFAAAAVYGLSIPRDAIAEDCETLLEIDWVGDVGRLYLGSELVADQFWYGPRWEVGLRRLATRVAGDTVDLRLELMPWHRDAPVFVSEPARTLLAGCRSEHVADPAAQVLALRSVQLVPQPLTRLVVRSEEPSL